MTTGVLLAAVLALGIGGGFVWLLQRSVASRGTDPYAPESADATEYLRSGLALHPDVEVKDGIEEEVRPAAACAAHLRVEAMNGTQVDTELAAMVRGHLAELWAAPARLEGLYLVPEEKR